MKRKSADEKAAEAQQEQFEQTILARLQELEERLEQLAFKVASAIGR